MREGTRDSFVKWLTTALIVAILVGGLICAWPTYRRTKDLHRQSEELDRRIASKRAEIAKLVEYQKRFKTDRDFVEAIARQNRRVYPGELVFVFDEKAK